MQAYTTGKPRIVPPSELSSRAPGDHVLAQPAEIFGRDPPVADGAAQQDEDQQRHPGVGVLPQPLEGRGRFVDDTAQVGQSLDGHTFSFERCIGVYGIDCRKILTYCHKILNN
jgi:hypothetical protein